MNLKILINKDNSCKLWTSQRSYRSNHQRSQNQSRTNSEMCYLNSSRIKEKIKSITMIWLRFSKTPRRKLMTTNRSNARTKDLFRTPSSPRLLHPPSLQPLTLLPSLTL